MKALTLLEQPALPVELKATLERAGRLPQGSDGTCEAGGPAGASLGIGVQPPQRQSTSRAAIDAVLRLDAPLPSREVAAPKRYSATGNDDPELWARFIVAMCRA